MRIAHEVLTLGTSMCVSWFIYIGFLYLTYRNVSRLHSIYLFLLSIAFIGAHRVLLRLYYRLKGGRGFDSRNILIIGEGPVAQQVANAVQENSWVGLYLVGLISTGNGDEKGDAALQPIIGEMNEIGRLVEEFSIEEVIIAPVLTNEENTWLIRKLYTLPVNVRIIPNITEDIFLKASVEKLGDYPLITLREPVLLPGQRMVKRVFDVVVGSMMLLLASPLMLLIALAIRLDSKGPVLFSQDRVGEGRKIFRMLKFRTMINGADERW